MVFTAEPNGSVELMGEQPLETVDMSCKKTTTKKKNLELIIQSISLYRDTLCIFVHVCERKDGRWLFNYSFSTCAQAGWLYFLDFSLNICHQMRFWFLVTVAFGLLS